MFLLFTHKQDFYTIDLVKQHLEQKGFDALRLNTNDFPTAIELSKNFGTKKSDTIYHNGNVIEANDVEGVWMRKFFSPEVDPDIDPTFRKGCFDESLATLKGFFYTLNHVTWIDPLNVVYHSSSKTVQLQEAHKQGLIIPKTIITNRQSDLEEFYHANNGNIIVKMQTALSVSMSGGGMFLYTSKVKEEDIKEAGLVNLCPLIFQELVEKEYELRIIYVDGKFFTGKIDTSLTMLGKTDCRMSKPQEVCWQRYELPQNVCDALTRYMKSLGLLFGAIDMIKTPKNDYIFLEVNPTGEWGMLQRDLGYPIAEAIASTLISKRRQQ